MTLEVSSELETKKMLVTRHLNKVNLVDIKEYYYKCLFISNYTLHVVYMFKSGAVSFRLET